ncbi:hypothetical protein [Caulobacter sp. DWR1-3-2b1]
MTRHTPRRAVAAPRWFAAALMAGAATIVAVSAIPPSPAAHTEWRSAQ